MIRTTKHIIQIVIASAVLLSVFVQIANRGVNMHSHMTADGRFISHAHPLLPSDSDQEHSHKAGELLFLGQINHLLSVDTCTLDFTIIERPFVHYCHLVLPSSRIVSGSTTGRSPPYIA